MIQRFFQTLSRVPKHRRLLVGLILLVCAWDLRAILLDSRFRGTDNFTSYAADASFRIQEQGFLRWWASFSGSKGPLPILLSLPLLLLIGRLPLASRLLSATAHGLLTWQCSHLGSRMSQNPSAGLWAALLCATTPVIFGLFRLTHFDVPLAILILGTIQLIAVYSPDRPRRAVWLGLVTGGGLITKPTFAQYVLWPYLCLALRWWRSRRFWFQSLIVAGLSVLLLFPWLGFHVKGLSQAILGAYWAGSIPVREKLMAYAILPEVRWLFVGALISLVALALRRRVSRFHLGLLLSSIPMLVSVLWLVDWSRYLLPIIPMLAIPIGLVLGAIQSRLPRLLRLSSAGLLAGLLLLRFVLYNVYGLPPPPGETRERYCGMITPDRRDYPAYRQVIRALPGNPPRVSYLPDTWTTVAEANELPSLWNYHGPRVDFISLEEVKRDLAEGREAFVVLVRSQPDLTPMPRPSGPTGDGFRVVMESARPQYLWMVNWPRRQLLASARDPDGIEISLWRLW